MAIIKCKMCGGDLDIAEGTTVAECEYCGTKQTVPSVDSEKKLTLFGRANRLRLANEFDKAAGVYESIVADFPEEAEAYWGLVLCRYGIEYVDDPATGKKIPTCHRSSFESVMEDGDFEQACENADGVARRQYREEAKQIEEIRKGIIEVSGKEEPYDIFICYKETDENGDRTIDSVIAQDVYDALTGKGYRVFFSRISLEDKLGTEYEPYIFAALNSAKVMLAFGTDYEYYNAVWVKNEWSRFLKLMAADKSKHLIPCYKGIDAYDMPKEFAKLQAQDMGKVGAMQDLVRGIEKILPRDNTPQAERIQQPQVIQQVVQSGGPNVDSQLKRGQQALEDHDWKKADEFFDKALDMDAECAEAFWGKALAAAKCVNGEEFVQKRIAIQPDESDAEQLLAYEPDTERIENAVQRYTVPGYLSEENIRGVFNYDEREYASLTAAWRERIEQEARFWDTDRLLSRAVRYAKGEFAETFKLLRAEIDASLQKALQESKARDSHYAVKIRDNYNAQIQHSERIVQERYERASSNRENDYARLCQMQVDAQTSSDFEDVAEHFIRIGMISYKDCDERYHQCKAEAERLRKANEAEAERSREERKQLEAERTRKRRKSIIAFSCSVAAVVAIAIVITQVLVPNKQYQLAEKFYSEGHIYDAARAWYSIKEYKDAWNRCMQAYKRSTISASANHTVALKADGTVVAVGQNSSGQSDIASWNDIVEVSAGELHTVALKEDGAALATGNNADGQCDVADWRKIVSISAGGKHTVGLMADGTVVAKGQNNSGQCNVLDWTDIVMISAGENHSVGLRADGTVVAVGFKGSGRCDVATWGDVVEVSAGGNHTVALKKDGAVLATGNNGDGQCAVSDWRNILAISAAGNHTVGLKADGTVVAIGNNDYGQCDVADWTNIVAISAGATHTVGLKADGTVIATGANSNGQCDVDDWTGIRVPER